MTLNTRGGRIYETILVGIHDVMIVLTPVIQEERNGKTIGENFGETMNEMIEEMIEARTRVGIHDKTIAGTTDGL